jgi:hypothetical protein
MTATHETCRHCDLGHVYAVWLSILARPGKTVALTQQQNIAAVRERSHSHTQTHTNIHRQACAMDEMDETVGVNQIPLWNSRRCACAVQPDEKKHEHNNTKGVITCMHHALATVGLHHSVFPTLLNTSPHCSMRTRARSAPAASMKTTNANPLLRFVTWRKK